MEIRLLTAADANDLNLKNEPFTMPGRFIPSLSDGVWAWRADYYETPGIMCFPDESYDLEALNKDGAVLGAYENGKCIGLAILQNGFLSYMYLWDLKVSAACRGKGVGKALIAAAMELARARGYRGLYCQAQDDNLNACLFYLRAGFRIGGFDNRVYTGTKQENKADIIFYLDMEK